MAGFGFNNTATKMAKSTARKPMGIQFVKSSEVVGHCQEPPATLPEDSATLFDSQSQGNSHPSSTNTCANGIPSLMSRQVAPSSEANDRVNASKPNSAWPGGQAFVKCGESYSSLRSNNSGSGSGPGYRMPGQSGLDKGVTNVFQRVAEAKPVCSTEEYLKAWRLEKDPDILKIRKLAHEVINLKSDRPNAKDKLHSAANRVPLRIEFNTEPVFGVKGSNSFLCHVYIEGVSIASGQGPKMKGAKTNAYEAALQKILMPHLRIVPIDPTRKELQVSRQAFTVPPIEPSKIPLKSNQSAAAKEKEVPSQHKESNMEAAGLKRRYNEYKPLDEFVIVEPKVSIQDCTPAHTLRRSADFNHMLLEYEYFFKGESARCILRIENESLADVSGVSKAAAKNTASAQALVKLKKFCWIIKTKQAVDSNTKISKDEMLNELNEQSDIIGQDNVGNKLLRKMGWSGGGVGKDGSGIAEPVSLRSVLNREGLGLSSTKGVTDEFRRKIKEVIESYAASDNQEDLVFSSDFRLEERQVIHDECRRLNLRSKSRGKGQKRYLCVRRKRSVNQLFDHLMSVGGETARYQLVPPGRDHDAPGYGSGITAVAQCSVTSEAASPRPSASFSNSNSSNSAAPPHTHMQDSKQFFPQNRSSLLPPKVANLNVGEGMQRSNRQTGWTPPHQGANIPASFRASCGSGNNYSGTNSMFGNCSPHSQNQYSATINSRGQTAQNSVSNFQPSAFSMSSANTGPGGMAFNSSIQTNGSRMDSRQQSAMMNTAGYNNHPDNISTNTTSNSNDMMYQRQNESPSFRQGRNNMQGHGGPQQMGWVSGECQQNSVPNSYAFVNQDGGAFHQGRQNNVSMSTPSFMNEMPPQRNHSMAPSSATGMTSRPAGHPEWDSGFSMGPSHTHNGSSISNSQWGGMAGNYFNGGADIYSNPSHDAQQQHQSQRMNMGMGNFNSNMMGGGHSHR